LGNAHFVEILDVIDCNGYNIRDYYVGHMANEEDINYCATSGL
jgi:hypothetical protein